MSASFATPDRANVQGLILRGYTHPFSCHLLFSFSTGAKSADTKSFFNDLYPKVQNSLDWGTNKPVSMLNIGLTFNGLSLLNIVAQNDLINFPASYRQGPWSGGSQASLADVFDPDSTPSGWWNGNGDAVNASLHCVIHAYALTNNDLTTLVNFITTSATKNGLKEILPLAPTNSGGRLYQSIVYNDQNKIHFGYTDGISEPSLSIPGTAGLPTAEDYSNFLIGYANSSISEPGPFDTSTSGVFAKDGCYNAFRIIYQDVYNFNNFIKDQAKKFADTLSYLGLSEPELEEWFAAKLCGRWRNGSPLMLNPLKPGNDVTPGTGEGFGYTELSDPTLPNADIPSGARCPFSAHTRVANPRNQALDSSEGSNGPPRILRRGMPYGPTFEGTTRDDVDRGLIGLFLCGNLSGQFEKIYGWMNYNNFSDPPVYGIKHPPQDALLGNRKAVLSPNFPGLTLDFTIPLEGNSSVPSITVTLPSLLKTRGTAYCLLPGMASIAKMAGRS
ncbi:MAG: hypothetical protein IAF38_02705 [Bacteroidia bacterium]|nr:hypothetical protein [Bacteroidia bacterium]